MTMTITEALAEIKTIDKRLNAKKKFISTYLARPSNMLDPLEKDGGSPSAILSEMQAIGDLEKRIVELRRAIQKANDNTELTIDGTTRTVSDWLVWRREVSEERRSFLHTMSLTIKQIRDNFKRNLPPQNDSLKDNITLVVNIDEKKLAAELEEIENLLGKLDGQLSLKNATVMVD